MLFKEIDLLLKQQFELGKKMQMSEYNLLQAQINPHFLYNALDFINLSCIKYNIPQISDVIHSLAKFYKLSLNNGASVISIQNEIEHIKAYLNIQNCRFNNPVKLIVSIRKDDLKLQIPNLILQPLAENALLHGILKSTSKNGIIKVSVLKNEATLIIKVEDNGVGYDIEKLNNMLCKKQENKSYGIQNVNMRIKLKYGESYGLKYESSPLNGVSAIINLPPLG